MEWAGPGGWGVVAAGTEVAALPPEIWAASVADLTQDLSAPDLVLSWKTNHCVLLSMLTMAIAAPTGPHPRPSGLFLPS